MPPILEEAAVKSISPSELKNTSSISTAHLIVEKIASCEYRISNTQGRLICRVIFRPLPDENLYYSECNCILGRKDVICHHLLAVIQKVEGLI